MDALEALSTKFLPGAAYGPSEATYWHTKFHITKESDDELLKDNVRPCLFHMIWFQLAELVN